MTLHPKCDRVPQVYCYSCIHCNNLGYTSENGSTLKEPEFDLAYEIKKHAVSSKTNENYFLGICGWII